MGPRLKSLTRDNFSRRAAIYDSPVEGELSWKIVLNIFSWRYRMYELRFKTPRQTT
jgi:hypothetical protein